MSFALRTVFTLALLSSIGAAHAQSSYTLTKLNPPFLGKHHDTPGAIDSQNRVTATARYPSGFNLFGPAVGFSYSNFVSRWSASASSSLSPNKLINESHNFNHQSPDGSKVFFASNQRYYDAVTRQFVAVVAPTDSVASWSVNSISDNGAMTGIAYLYSKNPDINPGLRAVRWMPGAAAPELLPIGDKLIAASGAFINQSGAVTADVRMIGSDLTRAVLWRESGALEVLNNEADTNSRPLGITESGDVLLGIENASTSTQRFAVISNGSAKPIDAPNPDDRLLNAAINAGGLVVGTFTQPSAPAGLQDRGFIWKDGVFTDLTAWVTAKGLKLPTGAVISAAWRVNAQGSILASMRAANGTITLVRLTAKP